VANTTYHQQLAQQKRAAIVDAAASLFRQAGYARTSLAKIAADAGVSKATLFRQFPTKAELFEAMVADYWKLDDEPPPDPADDLGAGLTEIGRRYVALLTRPGMADLFRIVIAEAHQFPELGRTHFALGKQPFWQTVRDYLDAQAAAGRIRLDHPEIAATQFLGMIADYVFWPRLLLPDWSPAQAAMDRVVIEAAHTMVARYVTPRD
jgi:TetR/AcrR family transcriptional regulator of autoinduction and epiphytic fitness